MFKRKDCGHSSSKGKSGSDQVDSRRVQSMNFGEALLMKT